LSETLFFIAVFDEENPENTYLIPVETLRRMPCVFLLFPLPPSSESLIDIQELIELLVVQHLFDGKVERTDDGGHFSAAVHEIDGVIDSDDPYFPLDIQNVAVFDVLVISIRVR
jgi:hypothetical protein